MSAFPGNLVVSSETTINSPQDKVWEQITNVDIGIYRQPFLFDLLRIPRPISAKLLKPGVGGERVAYFSSGKKFSQVITHWRPPESYSFDFAPDENFKVGYFFDLNSGPFRIVSGSYRLKYSDRKTRLQLESTYFLGGTLKFLAPLFKTTLRFYQKHLLESVKTNVEKEIEARKFDSN